MTTIERLWAQLDALRHLSPVHPARQAALVARGYAERQDGEMYRVTREGMEALEKEQAS